MIKKLLALGLAFALLAQTLVPSLAWASNENPPTKVVNQLITMEKLDSKNYPKLDNKTILEIQRQARDKRKTSHRQQGASMLRADSPYLPGQNPNDQEKAAAYANVSVKFATEGLMDNGVMKPFQWKEIFGQDSNGKPSKAKIIFLQKDAKTNAEMNRFTLEIAQDGTYNWTDQYGKPAKLPLYSTALEPYRYEVALDHQTSDKVTFLTIEIGKSDSQATYKKDSDGNIVADISLNITLGQVASTKFTSKWFTNLPEGDRPPVEGLFDHDASNGDITDEEGFFKFPKNDTGQTILRNDSKTIDDYNGFDEFYGHQLRTVPIVKVVEGYDSDTDSATYTLDEASKTITSLGGKKFKYDFDYDVINGGKLTMTEVLPVTFDANGGTFASITAPGAEQKVVKEVDFAGTVDATSVEKPSKGQTYTFKGWGIKDAAGTITPAEEVDYQDIKAAKTFYAIWTDRPIQAGEVIRYEIYKDGSSYDLNANDPLEAHDALNPHLYVVNNQGGREKYTIPSGYGLFYVPEEKDMSQGQLVTFKEHLQAAEAFNQKISEETGKDSTAPFREVTWRFQIIKDMHTPKPEALPQLVTGTFKVYKNIYPGLTDGGKPDYVPQEFVKVTVVPTDKAENSQIKYYYVNPKAKVIIPEEDPTGKGDNVFLKWTQKADELTTDPTDISIAGNQRNKFEKATTITAQYVVDVIPQKGTDKPKNVPEDFVEVNFLPGPNGTIANTEVTKYWVNPTKEVSLTAPAVEAKADYKHTGWDKALTQTFKAKTDITAQYKQKVLTTDPNDQDYVKVDFSAGQDGTIANTETGAYWVLKDVEVTLTAPAVTPKTGKKIDTESPWSPAVQKSYTTNTTHTAQYAYDGDDVVPQEGTDKPDVPANFVKVIVQLTDKAKITDAQGAPLTGNDYAKAISKTFWVNPTKTVTIPVAKPTGRDVAKDKANPIAFSWKFTGWQSGENPAREWKKDVDAGFKGRFTEQETTVTAQYVKDQADNGNLVADPLKLTESVQDGERNFINDFIPSDSDLEAQVRLKGGNPIPNDATVELILGARADGSTYTSLNEELYDKLQEKDNPNGEPTRIETVQVKVTFKNGQEQTVDIPIIVYKNIYQAKTLTERPYYVPDTYKKVTLDPTTKAMDPQKTVFYVNPNAYVTIPGADPTGVGGNKFIKWTVNPGVTQYKNTAVEANGSYELAKRYKFADETTITAQYVSDVIPQPGNDKPDTVPNGYVSVTFVSTDDGTLEGPSVFWVNPDKDVTIPVKTPTGKQHFTFKEWKLGANADGVTYTPSTPTKFTENTTITATYTEAADIIPYDPAEPMTKPAGYVRVSFDSDVGLSLTEVKHYYVKTSANKTLKDIKEGKGYGYPTYTAEVGYAFTQWDKGEDTSINADITVTAKAKPLADKIPKTKDDASEKPDGYFTVNFVAGEHGQITTGTTTFYVNPKKHVQLNPPTATGHTGYEFGSWNQDATIPTVYSKDTTITASFNKIGDVIPKKDGSQKPDGYVTVSFAIDGGGGQIKAGETTAYYVNPAAEVSLEAPAVSANTGHAFAAWTPNPAEARKYSMDTTILGTFVGYPDIVPGKDEAGKPNAKPEAYVTVTFVTGSLGQLEGETVYYVNPDAGKVLGDLAKPTIKAKSGVKVNGWNQKDSKAIVEDLIVVAEYEFTQEKSQPGGGSGWITPPSTPDKPGAKPSESDLNKVDHYQYLVGYPDGTFAPNRGMTRAEVATMFTRLLKDRPIKWKKYDAGFSDVQSGDWYANTVGYAVQKGIVAGYPDGTFQPNKAITRAEFSAIASRFAALTDEKDITFIDLAADHWGYKAIRLAASHGWISGYPDDTFQPERAITRAEVTSITNRMLNRYGDLAWIDSHPDLIIHFADVARTDWYYEPIMEATMGHDFTRDVDGKHEHWTRINWKSFI